MTADRSPPGATVTYEAVGLMVEEYRERGLPGPEPLATYSGQFNVRLPRSLHREPVTRAREQGVSLNALVTVLLAQATGQRGEPRALRAARK